MWPKPFGIQTRGETGLDTLIDSGRLAPTPHYPGDISDWKTLLSVVAQLSEEPHEFKTLFVDTINGAERLCHEHVCARDFNGDWTDRGFMGYMRGYEVALADWREFLAKLDTLREKRKMVVLLLCHTKVAQFKNPTGSDYDRYQPDMHAKTWSLTHKWADCVLFGNFETFLVNEKRPEQKTKAVADSGATRIMYAERRAAWDAKNRLGLPPEIAMGDSSQEAFQNFTAAVRAGRGATANEGGK